ncbi:MAG: FAD-dependent oxidoreductase [bacterium]|nr:FAD-dependent oxidoreductase [bacterium]
MGRTPTITPRQNARLTRRRSPPAAAINASPPQIVIVGGGLTGLAAAWELETLGIGYTLIEVKPRLGGAILTERRDGFTLDGTAFVFEKYGAWDFLEPLGLADAIRYVGRYRDGRLAIFKTGTQTLTEALAARITHPVMKRMAVSSVGRIDDGRYGVCLENGLLIPADGLILCIPARHIAHMLYSLHPEAALLFDGYTYDAVVRVHLGYHKRDFDPSLPLPALPPTIKYLETYDYPDRVPADHLLIRAGVRLPDPAPRTLDTHALSAAVRGIIPTRAEPTLTWTYYWGEADPLTRHLPEFQAALDQVDRLLPPTVAIAGSDYRARRLDQQVRDGRAAAHKVTAALR